MKETGSHQPLKRAFLFCLVASFAFLQPMGHSSLDASAGDGQATGGSPSLDVMFVVDNSGSMKKNDPGFITREVVTKFSKSLSEHARLGMVIFDKDARLVEPLTEKKSPAALAAFVRNTDQIDFRGQLTNSPAGIERALYELKTHGREDGEKVIVFLTDGIVDTGDKRRDREKEAWLQNDLAEESKKADVRIFGIAFTEQADVQLIQTLALKTNGEYFRAYAASDIPAVFEKVTDLVTRPNAGKPPAQDVIPPEETKTDTVRPGQETPAVEQNEIGSGRGRLFFALVVVAICLLGAGAFLRFFRNNRRQTPAARPSDGSNGATFPANQMVPDVRLVDLKGAASDQSRPVPLGKKRVTVGRDPTNDLVIPKETISSFHATIEFKDGFFYVEDHRSTNGTYLNGKKIEQNTPMKLKSGDMISFAAHDFKFLMLDQAPIGETVMLKSSSLPMADQYLRQKGAEEFVDDVRLFRDCLNKHLASIVGLGEPYAAFVKQYLNEKTTDLLALRAKESMLLTQKDLDEHNADLKKPPVLFRLCTLPVSIEHAHTWFTRKHGGYVKYLTGILNSQPFTEAGYTVLCVIVYGRTQNAWVSMTVVPTAKDMEQVEIMSVEFLSEAEKNDLSLKFGELGRIV